MKLFPDLTEAEKRRLILSALLVGALGIIVLALPIVIPLLGFLAAFGIIGAAIYGIYRYFTGK